MKNDLLKTLPEENLKLRNGGRIRIAGKLNFRGISEQNTKTSVKRS